MNVDLDLLDGSVLCLQCSDTVGWAAGRASGLLKTERWGAGLVICLERGADLHIAQLMPLPLTVSCFSKIQIGFTFLVPADPGSPGQRAVKWVSVMAACVTMGILATLLCNVHETINTVPRPPCMALVTTICVSQPCSW